jgi:hypothetical protein
MAKQRKKKIKSTDELNTENEFLKMKMMAEFGGEFVGSTEIPPDIENAFLKQIEKIQRAHAVAVTVSLYELIEKPEYSHVHDLSDKAVAKELKRLLKLMDKKGVSLVSVSGIGDRELYRFLTEELFKREVESINLKGWKLHFVYEDFYPNHSFDVKRTVHDAVIMLIDKENPPYEAVFDDDMRDKLGLQVDFEEWINNLKIWQSRFNRARLDDMTLEALDVNEENTEAYLRCSLTYGLQAAKGKRFTKHDYTLEFWLSHKPDANWWLVNRVNFDEL